MPYCCAAKSMRKEVGASHFAVLIERPMFGWLIGEFVECMDESMRIFIESNGIRGQLERVLGENEVWN